MIEDSISSISSRLNGFKSKGKSIFLSSSFQTQSLILLKIISDFDKTIPVYFLNTGYHFPETILYKNQLTNLFNLNVIDLYSDTPILHQRDAMGRLFYTSDPDRCCELNKIIPLQIIIRGYDVWITGIRQDQTTQRKTAKKIEKLKNGTFKYNPLLDWNKEDVFRFIEYYSLPRHPLDPDGINSIGCQPCTRIVNEYSREQSRWYGQTKTECGIHLELQEKI